MLASVHTALSLFTTFSDFLMRISTLSKYCSLTVVVVSACSIISVFSEFRLFTISSNCIFINDTIPIDVGGCARPPNSWQDKKRMNHNHEKVG